MKSDVIDLNIPLLLCLDSMKKGGVKNFNLMDGTITILNQKVKLTSSQSGHFLIALQEGAKVENKSIRRNKVTPQHGGNSGNKHKVMSLSPHSNKVISQENRQHYSKNGYQQHCNKNGYHLYRSDCENKRSHGKHDQRKSRNYNIMNKLAIKKTDGFVSYMYNKEQLSGKKSRKIARNETETLFTRLGNEHTGCYNFKNENDKGSITFDERK